jgi:hypothetical protein
MLVIKYKLLSRSAIARSAPLVVEGAKHLPQLELIEGKWTIQAI